MECHRRPCLGEQYDGVPCVAIMLAVKYNLQHNIEARGTCRTYSGDLVFVLSSRLFFLF